MASKSEYNGFATKAIHVAQEPEKWDYMSVVTPIVTSSVYKHLGPGEFLEYEYSRCGNPTRNTLESCLAALENAKYGLTFATGIGAITSITQLFENGDHILTENDMYGGTHRLLNQLVTKWGIEISSADFNDLDNFEKHLKNNTKLIWLETPTNPTLRVVDIQRVSTIAHNFNKNIIIAVDNTFLTPYFQLPLAHGADMVMHSVSKYLNGHGDVVMGAVVLNREDLHKRLRFIQNASGIVPGPFDCFQVLRGLKTLKIRMREHSENGLKVAKFLEQHPFVNKLRHPGLPSHPNYDITQRQTTGHSGVFSFYLKGNIDNAKKFVKSLKLITLAGSLGSPQSLIEIPKLMSHASITSEEHKKVEITETLIRISVGLEEVEDIIADLDMALNECQKLK